MHRTFVLSLPPLEPADLFLIRRQHTALIITIYRGAIYRKYHLEDFNMNHRADAILRQGGGDAARYYATKLVSHYISRSSKQT